MIIYQDPQINKQRKQISFCFLDKKSNDFIKDVSIDLDLNSQNPYLLDQIVKLESDESGVSLNVSTLNSLSDHLFKKISEVFRTNPCLKTNDKELEAFFYTLTEIPQYPTVKLLYCWVFSAKKIEQTRKYWCAENGLIVGNCCTRNFLMQFPDRISFSEKRPNVENFLTNRIPNIKDNTENSSVKNFCLFPKCYVKVKVFYFTHLINPLLAEKEFQILDIRLNNLTTNNTFCLIPNKNSFYSMESLLNSEKISNPLVKELLELLDNKNIENLNCQDLLLTVEKENLRTFLYNAFFTCYMKQLKLTPQKKQNITKNVKVLKCVFSF